MLHKTLLVVCVALLSNLLTLAQTSSATARKFDEFGDIQASDLIARLNNLAVTLSYEPSSKAFLIVYRTRRDIPGLSNRYAHRMEGLSNRVARAAFRTHSNRGWWGCFVSFARALGLSPGSSPKPREDTYDNSFKPSVYKFDEHYYQVRDDPWEIVYWPLAPTNLIGYLESFGETLVKDRKLVGYLIAFRDPAEDNPETTKRMLRTERNFLIREFRIEPRRLKTIDGGYRPSRTMELWIAQPGYRPIITSFRLGRVRSKR